MVRDKYLKGDIKKVTSPIEAGYLNLRIKSSKAFPMSDVGTIEEIIHKMQKIKEDKNKRVVVPMEAANELV